MARRVPGRAGGKTWDFIPAAFANDLDVDPITIVIRTPTEARKRDLFVAAEREVKRLVAEGVSPEHARSIAWLSTPVLMFVESVRSYKSSAGEPIVTAAELLEHGETEVVSETVKAILGRNELDAEEKKSSAAPSGSASPEITPSDGTAATAAHEASTSSAGAA